MKPLSYSPEHALCLGRAGSSCLYLCLFPHIELLVRSGLGLAHQFRLLWVTCLIVLDIHSFIFGGRGRAFARPYRLGPACFYLVLLFLKDKITEQAWLDSTRQRMSSERRVEKKNPNIKRVLVMCTSIWLWAWIPALLQYLHLSVPNLVLPPPWSGREQRM